MNDTPETFALLHAGNLQQTCPACGHREAAGSYCTRCETPLSPADWHRRPRAPRKRATPARDRTGHSVDSQAKRAADRRKSAPPGPLA